MRKHFFKSLEIENFRGIKESKIEDLARVNLFVGKNGCGKTTVLESLMLLSKIADPRQIIHLQHFKGIDLIDSKQLADVFFEQKHKNKLRLMGIQESGNRELRVRVLYVDTHSGQTSHQASSRTNGSVKNRIAKTSPTEFKISNGLEGLEYDFSISPGENRRPSKYNSKIIGNWFGSTKPVEFKFQIDEEYKEELPAEFMLEGGHPPYNVYFIDKMLEEKRKNILLESLQIIQPGLLDIKTGPMGVSADIGLDNFIPINLLGDGLRHMIGIVSTIDSTRDGILMIDEFGSGLHVSCVVDTWKILIEQSRKCDTQIFMTTHSKDVIEGLASLYEQRPSLFSEDEDDVACFYLDKDGENQVKGYRFSPEDLKHLMQSDTDIRL